MSAGARCLWSVVCGLLLAGAPLAVRCLHAAATLAQLTGSPLPETLSRSLAPEVTVTTLPVPTPRGALRAHRYRPQPAPAGPVPGVVLLHGVHARGIDEARLRAFATTLARAGLDVLTPELPELLAYRLEPITVGRIRELAAAHAAAVRQAAVGVIGISFAGGLALMAAAEQAADRPIGAVMTLGAHHDLLRLCRFYTGREVRGPLGEPAGTAPHPYGARVLLREHLDRLVGAADLPLAQRALDLYLRDDHTAARRMALQLSASGREVMAVVLGPDSSEVLSRWVGETCDHTQSQLSAASPRGHLRGLMVPVFLLHGARDPIIPSVETRFLARELSRPWLRAAVVSPLLRHAEFPEAPAWRDTWELVRFVQHFFDAAGSSARLR
ncbi:MAG: hypothetical protein ABW321_22460 [Polyangiales bacterium]